MRAFGMAMGGEGNVSYRITFQMAAKLLALNFPGILNVIVRPLKAP